MEAVKRRTLTLGSARVTRLEARDTVCNSTKLLESDKFKIMEVGMGAEGEAPRPQANSAEEIGGRPKRERKQVERIRSSELRTANKRASPAKGMGQNAGKSKSKVRSSTGSTGGDDDDDDDAEAEDLDVPLTARGSKPAETERKTPPPKKTTPQSRRASGGSAGKGVKKQRVSMKVSDEDNGLDRDSEEALCIRSALMELCDQLGEKALEETTPKLLRRNLEKQIKKAEGALDEWKKVINEWYELGEQIKKALRKFLQELDENAEPTPKTIRRELEHQLDLDEGELDSWKTEIDRWTIKFNEEVDALSPSPSRTPKGKALSNDGDAEFVGGDANVPTEKDRRSAQAECFRRDSRDASQGDSKENTEPEMRADKNEDAGATAKKRSAPEDGMVAAGSGSGAEKRPEKRIATPEKILSQAGTEAKDAKDKRDESHTAKENTEKEKEKPEQEKSGARGNEDDAGNRKSSEGSGKIADKEERNKEGKKREERKGDAREKSTKNTDGNDKDQQEGRVGDKRRDSKESGADSRRNSKEFKEGGTKEGGDKERHSDHKERGREKDRESDRERGDKREKEKEKAEKTKKEGRHTGAHSSCAETDVPTEPSGRPNEIEGAGRRGEGGEGGGGAAAGGSNNPVDAILRTTSSFLERKGKQLSVLQVKPLKRESSTANEFRACPLQDLVELETALAAAEREAAARQQQEKEATARRLREEQEAAARRAQEERAQEKIREAAKKPLPSFKDVMKKKCAEAPKKEDESQQISKPPRLSDARPVAVLKSSSDAREGAGSDKNGGEVRSFGFFLFFLNCSRNPCHGWFDGANLLKNIFLRISR